MLSTHRIRCEALGFLQSWEISRCFPRDLAGNGGANPQRAVEPRKSLLELSAPGLAGVSDAARMASWPGSGPACLKCGEMPAFLGKERSGVGASQKRIKRGERGWGERVFSQLQGAERGAQPIARRDRMLLGAV